MCIRAERHVQIEQSVKNVVQSNCTFIKKTHQPLYHFGNSTFDIDEASLTYRIAVKTTSGFRAAEKNIQS